MCHKKSKTSQTEGLQHPTNAIQLEAGRTHTPKHRLSSIIMPKITPLQNYNGLQEARMTSVSGTHSNENLHRNFTLAGQNISIFFSLRKESRLKFSCFAKQARLHLLPGNKTPICKQCLHYFNSAPPRAVWYSQNILLLGL
jgi:hypothetical protein